MKFCSTVSDTKAISVFTLSRSFHMSRTATDHHALEVSARQQVSPSVKYPRISSITSGGSCRGLLREVEIGRRDGPGISTEVLLKVLVVVIGKKETTRHIRYKCQGQISMNR